MHSQCRSVAAPDQRLSFAQNAYYTYYIHIYTRICLCRSVRYITVRNRKPPSYLLCGGGGGGLLKHSLGYTYIYARIYKVFLFLHSWPNVYACNILCTYYAGKIIVIMVFFLRLFIVVSKKICTSKTILGEPPNNNITTITRVRRA